MEVVGENNPKRRGLREVEYGCRYRQGNLEIAFNRKEKYTFIYRSTQRKIFLFCQRN